MLPRYEHCATRLENRGDAPPTRAYVDALVESYRATGVEAAWHSAVDPSGMPLFPSRVFPVHHPDANLGAFQYLLERMHSLNKPVLSWYPLNLGGGILPLHPEWRMEFYPFGADFPDPEDLKRFACLNTPYGDMLPDFFAEVVREVGFDGLWIDGSTNSYHWPNFAPGCRCETCRKRFRDDTGGELPATLAASDPNFAAWVHWRYDRLLAVWEACVQAVVEANPRATIGFNNYRRRSGLTLWWNTAIPLRTLGWDCLMSCELDNFPGQADVQMKILQAYQCRRGVDSWWPLADYDYAWVPDVEPLTAVQAVLGSIAAGGAACTGIGGNIAKVNGVLRDMQQAAAPRMPYQGGEVVEYAAILASQQTMDFYARPSDAWDGIHGANECYRHAHLQSSVIFDDYLDRGALARYPVLLLGNAACLSARQAVNLEAYVRDGGVLVACHDAGTHDATGAPHARPVLDDLLGIVARQPAPGPLTMHLRDDALVAACGPFVTSRGGGTLATPAADVNPLARLADSDGQPLAADQAVLWARPRGRGYAVYIGADFFANYLRTPTPRLMRLVRALLTGLCPPRLTLQGPQCVTVNTRVQPDGRWAVHLHNAPGSLYSYPTPPHGNYLHAPGEVLPVRDLILEIPAGGVRAAEAIISRQAMAVAAGRRVLVPEVALHEVVLLTMEASASAGNAG